MVQHLIVPLMFAALAVYAGRAGAQTTSPAPLPGQGAPSVGSPEPGRPADACMHGFMPLRDEAEKRGKLIREASDRHAAPDESCKLISSYSQAEIKMIRYVEANAAQCGARISEQLKNGHRTTLALEKKVCDVALQMQNRGPPVRFNDFGDPAPPNGGRLERR